VEKYKRRRRRGGGAEIVELNFLQRIEHKTRERRERERKTKPIYTGSYHKTKRVQSRCISKGFHYNLTRNYNCSSTLARDFSMLKFTNKRLLKLTKDIRKKDIKHLIYYQWCLQNTTQLHKYNKNSFSKCSELHSRCSRYQIDFIIMKDIKHLIYYEWCL
jgi:hypothetical protein